MFIEIQKKLNYILLFAIIFNLFIYIVLFYIFQLNKLNQILLFCIFLFFSLFTYFLFTVLESNLEYIEILKMVKKGQIALARIEKIQKYRKVKDSKRTIHDVYELNITVLPETGNCFETRIYESIRSDLNIIIPAFVYVTYKGDDNKIGIASNFILSSFPQLSKKIQLYEEKYNPNYIFSVRTNGIELYSVKDYLNRNETAL